MCWNATVSLNTFLFATFAASLCWVNRSLDPSTIATLMCFSSMQLIEYFIWTNLHNPTWNWWMSVIAFLTILIQPVFVTFQLENLGLRKWLLTLYGVFVMAYCALLLPSITFKTVVGSNGHLRWLWLNPPPYLIAIWAFFMFYPSYVEPSVRYRGSFLFGIVTLLVSLYNFSVSGTWGTMWCWFVNVIWLFNIILTVTNSYRSFVCLPPPDYDNRWAQEEEGSLQKIRYQANLLVDTFLWHIERLLSPLRSSAGC